MIDKLIEKGKPEEKHDPEAEHSDSAASIIGVSTLVSEEPEDKTQVWGVSPGRIVEETLEDGTTIKHSATITLLSQAWDFRSSRRQESLAAFQLRWKQCEGRSGTGQKAPVRSPGHE